MNRRHAELQARVARAAGEAVRARGYATAIDVFIGLGWLSTSSVTEYRTHWVSSALGEKKRERLAAKLERPPELVVTQPRNRDWKCHRCGGAGSLLMMEPAGPACLSCAGLGDLVILPSGDAKLTRKARAASGRTAVIVRWSKSRDRYERIGSLVEPAALSRACAELGLAVPLEADDETP